MEKAKSTHSFPGEIKGPKGFDPIGGEASLLDKLSSGFPLSESQLHFGEMQLECTSNRWGVTPLQAAKIMIDVEYIRNAWNWVNMDTFLNEYIHRNS